MTKTEQRLADALAARADAVDPSTVRPLVTAEPATERGASRRPRPWLAPAAASISIALVATVVTVASRHAPRAGQEPIGSQHATFHGELMAVDALSAANVWAVGTFLERKGDGPAVSEPLIMHWDGSGWRRVAAPQEGNGSLVSISGRSPDDLWAVGTWRRDRKRPILPLIMHWNGKRWLLTPFAAGARRAELSGVSALSATGAWAVGSGGKNGGLILHWNGRSWRQVPVPPTARSQFLESVAAISASDAWAVGADNQGELILHWNGERWQLAQGPASDRERGNLLNLTALSASEIWATGYGSGQDVLRILRWNGNTWRVDPGLNILGTEFFYAAGVIAPDDIWVVGRSSTAIVLRHWNGSRWSAPVHFRRSLPGILYGISARSARDAWAIGSFGYGLSGRPLILHWNGTRWSKVLD